MNHLTRKSHNYGAYKGSGDRRNPRNPGDPRTVIDAINLLSGTFDLITLKLFFICGALRLKHPLKAQSLALIAP